MVELLIAFVHKDAAREVNRRLMDAVDLVLVDAAERALAGVRRVAALLANASAVDTSSVGVVMCPGRRG